MKQHYNSDYSHNPVLFGKNQIVGTTNWNLCPSDLSTHPPKQQIKLNSNLQNIATNYVSPEF